MRRAMVITVRAAVETSGCPQASVSNDRDSRGKWLTMEQLDHPISCFYPPALRSCALCPPSAL